MTVNRKFIHIMYLLGSIMLLTTINQHASAEPYLAQKYGVKCSACHTNITGGGKRTVFGNSIASALAADKIAPGFSPNLNDNISIGADFRGSWIYTQFPDADPVNGVAQDSIEDTSEFSFTNGSLYLEFGLGDKLTFYLDQQVAPEGGRTREALMIYRGLLGESSYVKAGRFFLPFGLRLQDDQAFIRERTGFNFANADEGIEFGFEPGNWSFSLALSNGTQGSGENNTDKQVSFVGSYVQPKYRVGASFTNNNAPSGNSTLAYNVFGGLTFKDWVFLGEIDQLELETNFVETTQLASFVSVNYFATPSLNLKYSYDFFDPNDDIDEDEETRHSLLAEKFVNEFLQFRVGVRLYDGIPQNSFENRDIFFSELHWYF